MSLSKKDKKMIREMFASLQKSISVFSTSLSNNAHVFQEHLKSLIELEDKLDSWEKE